MFSGKIFLPLSVASIVLTGCAHGLMRGSVAMKVSDSEAHVCMNKSEAKVGDRVSVYRNNCPTKGPRVRNNEDVGVGRCTKVHLGQGTVTENINEHYSVVKFDAGVPFEEGAFIEK